MSVKPLFLCTYRLLLRCYPCSFRLRFAEDMLQLAKEAECSEWVLILLDTGASIVRKWFEPPPSVRTNLVHPAGEYVCLSDSPITPARFAQAFALALAINFLILCCIDWQRPPAQVSQLKCNSSFVKGSHQ